MRHNIQFHGFMFMFRCVFFCDLFGFYRCLSPVTYATVLICDFQFSGGYLFEAFFAFFILDFSKFKVEAWIA